ncbi:HET-domain-containing protein [Glonium stellatum]|uniref:HET-domain-containing protein n=1 Tax=Glonium stellatum TaxID=574774 RepID=A0A8E2F348_9PEZI|nr:HET-domain-containing protein [Glonium stellatum]
MTDIESTASNYANGREDAKLCARCEQLDLTIDKFIIGNASTTIARESQHDKGKKPDEARFRLKSGDSRKDLRELKVLRASRAACNFCDLVYKAIRHYSPDKTNDATTCSLTWEVDGRQVESDLELRYINKTRRIRLRWYETTGNRQEAYMVFVAPKDPTRPNSDARSKLEREIHFLGREFGAQKEKQALIKSWLDLCVKDHGEACHGTHGTTRKFKELTKETHFGVIDVVDMQLKALPIKDGKPERYVALSYVWGGKQQHKPPYTTTSTNIMTHILHGGLESAWDKLPSTIQDAILLVSRLGERYLWIDSLCIVQDSDSSWQLNAKVMHLVYGNSYFTICAADGIDSSAGLRAAKPILRALGPTDPLSEAMAGASLNGTQKSENDSNSQQMSAECAPGVRLMVARPLEAVINDSVWNKRAWTFQERVLSRRCLIFAEGRVYFQCRSTGISQDLYTDGKGSGWSLDRTNSPLRTLEELQQRPLWFYMKYVGMYTGRDLTKPRDILAAFQGISWLLERYMQAPSLFGIPTSHFDLALLWAPLGPISRRRLKPIAHLKNPCTENETGDCTCQLESESFGLKEFPSWAWSGWMGATIEYQLEMIEGCLLNIHEWLKYHTWIQWHIRDEKGHIRPLSEFLGRDSRDETVDPLELSDTDSRPMSFEDENRWKGYPRCNWRRGMVPVRTVSKLEGVDSVRYVGAPQRTRSYYGEANSNERHRDLSPNQRDSRSRPRSSLAPEYERVSNEHYVSRSRGSTFTPSINRTRSPPPSLVRRTLDLSDDDPRSRGSTFYIPRRPRVDSSGGYRDEYGRLIRAEIPNKRPTFQAILPGNPFGVISEKHYPQDPSEMQHMPILQFWTWRTELHVVARDTSLDIVDKNPSPQLSYCDIVDKERDWCGSIVLNHEWIRENQGSLFYFIAISEAKAFTKNECPVWTYYIPKERDECEWDLYYVLLLERNKKRGLWERVGIGKAFQAAFREKEWRERRTLLNYRKSSKRGIQEFSRSVNVVTYCVYNDGGPTVDESIKAADSLKNNSTKQTLCEISRPAGSTNRTDKAIVQMAGGSIRMFINGPAENIWYAAFYWCHAYLKGCDHATNGVSWYPALPTPTAASDDVGILVTDLGAIGS